MHGKMQEPGLTESSLRYVLQLSGTSVLFSHPEFPRGSPCGMAAVWCRLDDRYSLLSWVSSGFTGSLWRASVADDYDILVYWTSLYMDMFFWVVHRNRIAGLNAKFMTNCLRNSNCFPNWLLILHSHVGGFQFLYIITNTSYPLSFWLQPF